MLAVMVSDALGSAINVKVITESQPLEAGNIMVNVPVVLNVCDPHTKDWPWQMLAVMVSDALGTTINVKVITESQPLEAGNIMVNVPAVLNVCDPHTKDWPSQMLAFIDV